jgi:hypothetical protein
MATYPILLTRLTGDATAAREWVGLAAYRLTGRTTEFFPAP